jgi:high-affinity iron transporter
MIASFVIMFRETLEAALIVGIVLSYLARTRQTKYNNVVLIGASLLTTMILWMLKQRHIATELQDKVASEVAEAHRFGLFSLVFVAVLREGIETVIFLGAASFAATENNLIGALAGIAAAVLLGYAIFVGSMRINLKRFFNITSILLVLFAAGLVAQGVHELQEAGIIPTVIEHLWNINPPVNPDGGYPLLHERGYLGSILKGLFGYNGDPSLIEVLSYFFYLSLVFVWRRRTDRSQQKRTLRSARSGIA